MDLAVVVVVVTSLREDKYCRVAKDVLLIVWCVTTCLEWEGRATTENDSTKKRDGWEEATTKQAAAIAPTIFQDTPLDDERMRNFLP